MVLVFSVELTSFSRWEEDRRLEVSSSFRVPFTRGPSMPLLFPDDMAGNSVVSPFIGSSAESKTTNHNNDANFMKRNYRVGRGVWGVG